jgi:cytochrome P450
MGRGMRPGLKDRDNLHYLNAVVLESHRAIGHVPFGVVRQAQADVQAGPYTIPKGASILSGLYFIMNDPAQFKDPEKFNPERFIDPNTKKFVPNERVIPFGLGKRNCLGQALGEQEFFLFVGGILSMFEIRQVPGSVLPCYNIESSFPIGMVRSAPVFNVKLHPRIEFIN